MPGPEALARETIDAALADAGWVVQDYAAMNLHAGRGVVVREAAASGPATASRTTCSTSTAGPSA